MNQEKSYYLYYYLFFIKIDRKDEIIPDNEEKTFQFSFFDIFCFKFLKNSSYKQALDNVMEYIDIKHIIKRLQDIDKLKLVLFDEKQREVFDN